MSIRVQDLVPLSQLEKSKVIGHSGPAHLLLGDLVCTEDRFIGAVCDLSYGRTDYSSSTENLKVGVLSEKTDM